MLTLLKEKGNISADFVHRTTSFYILLQILIPSVDLAGFFFEIKKG